MNDFCHLSQWDLTFQTDDKSELKMIKIISNIIEILNIKYM